MWNFKHSITIDFATPNQVWQIWSDVENWNQWDDQIEYSTCLGSFSEGSKIELKPKNAPKTTGKIIHCEIDKTFTVVANLSLGTKLTFLHAIEQQDSGVQLTHSVTINGPLTHVFKGLIGKKIESSLPLAMENLRKLLAERNSDRNNA